MILREARRHRVLAALNVASVALGVAVFLAVQIVNRSAASSFENGVDLVAGRSHLEVRGEIADADFAMVAAYPGVKAATPLVEGVITLPDFPGEYLRVLGVDVFTNEPFRTFEIGSGGELDLERWLSQPGVVALSPAMAQRLGQKKLRAVANGEPRALSVLALMATEDALGSGAMHFAVMDIGWAQELLSLRGRLSSIQIRLENPEASAEVAMGLAELLPATATVAAPRQRSQQVDRMLGAFRLNLTALSLVSMLVAVFLIYNSTSAAVVRRRVEIGVLRSLGGSRTLVQGLFLAEAGALALLGVALGSVAGVAMAQVMIGSVARTISSLYLLLSIEHLQISPLDFLKAGLVAAAAVLVGAWRPALEASRVRPVEALHPPRAIGAAAPRGRGQWVWALGSLGVAAALSALALFGRFPEAGFGAAFMVVVAVALPAGDLVSAMGRAGAGVARGLLGRMASDNARRGVRRNAVTVAALSSAIAMLIGVTVMIHSFRRTVDAWIGQAIVADLFVAPAANEVTGLNSFLPGEVVKWWRSRPGVTAVETFRRMDMQVNGQVEAVAVVEGFGNRQLRFKGSGAEEAMRDFTQPDQVLVSESMARRLRVGRGDRLRVATPDGRVEMTVAGIYYDYTSDQGVIALSRENFARYWNDPRLQSLAVHLHPETEVEALEREFRATAGRSGQYLVYTNRQLRQRVFEIFDQTFAVTHALRGVAVIVGLAGIWLSVTVLVAERSRELAILRATGASLRQIVLMFLGEAGLLGAASSVLGVLGGMALSVVLTWVVNPAFFGWTIGLEFPWSALAWTPLWVVSVAMLAAFIPAWKGAEINLAEGLRAE